MSKVRAIGFTTFAFKFAPCVGEVQRKRYVYASATETYKCRKSLLTREKTLSTMIDGGAFDFDCEVSNAVTPQDDSVSSDSSIYDGVLFVETVDDADLKDMLPDADACYDTNDDESTLADGHAGSGTSFDDSKLNDMDLIGWLDNLSQ